MQELERFEQIKNSTCLARARVMKGGVVYLFITHGPIPAMAAAV